MHLTATTVECPEPQAGAAELERAKVVPAGGLPRVQQKQMQIRLRQESVQIRAQVCPQSKTVNVRINRVCKIAPRGLQILELLNAATKRTPN